MGRFSVAAAMLVVLAGCNILWGVDDLAIDDSSGAGGSGPSTTASGSSASSASGGSGPCDPTLSMCAGKCVDVSSNPEHCGDCNQPCAEGEACVDGNCGGQCSGTQILCPSGCVDPLSSWLHCGASGDCQDDNAGQACEPSESCDGGSCADSLINRSFEDMLNGWDVADVGNPYFPLDVDGTGVSPGSFNFFSSEPTHGSFALLHGWDGAPGTIEVGQDITLAAMSQAVLHFDYRAGWQFLDSNPQPRTFEVSIEPPGGGLPLDVQTILVATLSTNTPDTGSMEGSVNLAPYAGQTIYIRFLWTIPEDLSGPAFFQLDNVHLHDNL